MPTPIQPLQDANFIGQQLVKANIKHDKLKDTLQKRIKDNAEKVKGCKEKLDNKMSELKAKYEQDMKNYTEMYQDAIEQTAQDSNLAEEELKEADVKHQEMTQRLHVAVANVHTKPTNDKKEDSPPLKVAEATSLISQVAPTPPIPTTTIDKINTIPGLAVTAEQLQALIAALTPAAPPTTITPVIEEVPGDALEDQEEEDSEMKEAMDWFHEVTSPDSFEPAFCKELVAIGDMNQVVHCGALPSLALVGCERVSHRRQSTKKLQVASDSAASTKHTRTDDCLARVAGNRER